MIFQEQAEVYTRNESLVVGIHIPVVGSILVIVSELEAEDVVHELNSDVVAHCGSHVET
jgi:hypothetical protein